MGDWRIGKAHTGFWTLEDFMATWNPVLDADGQIVNFKFSPGQYPLRRIFDSATIGTTGTWAADYQFSMPVNGDA